jgi:hypothetical protein
MMGRLRHQIKNYILETSYLNMKKLIIILLLLIVLVSAIGYLGITSINEENSNSLNNQIQEHCNIKCYAAASSEIDACTQDCLEELKAQN